MKRIINGKLYDTDTAKAIGHYQKRKNIFLKHFYLFLSPLLERNINRF